MTYSLFSQYIIPEKLAYSRFVLHSFLYENAGLLNMIHTIRHYVQCILKTQNELKSKVIINNSRLAVVERQWD